MGAFFHLSIFLIEILIETEKLQDGDAFEMVGGGGDLLNLERTMV